MTTILEPDNCNLSSDPFFIQTFNFIQQTPRLCFGVKGSARSHKQFQLVAPLTAQRAITIRMKTEHANEVLYQSETRFYNNLILALATTDK